jgi:O-antigen ligase
MLQNGFRRTKIALLFLVLYAGLLVYSRGGLIFAFAGLAAVTALMIRLGRFSIAVPAAIACIIAVHLPSGGLSYYETGLQTFFTAPSSQDVSAERAARYSVDDVMSGSRRDDLSGFDRANAMKKGLSIAYDHWLTGIGSGHYVRADPVFTAPHSMALLRLDENGIVGLAALLALIAIAPLELLRRRRADPSAIADPLATSAGIAAVCFAVYASAFGGSFSDHGFIAWGFLLALLTAVTVRAPCAALSKVASAATGGSDPKAATVQPASAPVLRPE